MDVDHGQGLDQGRMIEPGIGKFAQGRIAACDQAHIDAERMARADRLHVSAIEELRQAFLDMAGQAVDLVDHQGAAVGMLKRADVPVERAGKGAFLVAEQHAFDLVGGNAAGVDDAQRRLGARAGGVHRADQHFLAGAAFALDQHGLLGARGLGRHGQRGAERRGRADHRIEIERRADLFGQRLQFGGRRFARGRAAQGVEQAVGRDRLDQVVGRACAHRFHRQQRRGAGGEHQDRQRGAAGLEFGDQGAGIVARNPLVEDDRAQLHALARAQHGNRGFGIARHDRAPAFARGQRRDQPALGRLIIDQHQQAVVGVGHGIPVVETPRV
jgi:hypothetical protein